jgi:hypothetical protein
MALPATLTAELGALLTANWSLIVADANANSGVTNISFSVKLTETSPPGGPMDFEIGFNYRYRDEVSKTGFEKVTGNVS